MRAYVFHNIFQRMLMIGTQMVLWVRFSHYRWGSAREKAYFRWTIGMKMVLSCGFSPYRSGSAREIAYYPCMIKACVVGLRKVKYIRSVKVVEG